MQTLKLHTPFDLEILINTSRVTEVNDLLKGVNLYATRAVTSKCEDKVTTLTVSVKNITEANLVGLILNRL